MLILLTFGFTHLFHLYFLVWNWKYIIMFKFCPAYLLNNTKVSSLFIKSSFRQIYGDITKAGDDLEQEEAKHGEQMATLARLSEVFTGRMPGVHWVVLVWAVFI